MCVELVGFKARIKKCCPVIFTPLRHKYFSQIEKILDVPTSGASWAGSCFYSMRITIGIPGLAQPLLYQTEGREWRLISGYCVVHTVHWVQYCIKQRVEADIWILCIVHCTVYSSPYFGILYSWKDLYKILGSNWDVSVPYLRNEFGIIIPDLRVELVMIYKSNLMDELGTINTRPQGRIGNYLYIRPYGPVGNDHYPTLGSN